MNERNKPVVGKFLLAAVRNGDLGRALHSDFALVGLECMCWQSLYETAAFDAADGYAPTMHRKRI